MKLTKEQEEEFIKAACILAKNREDLKYLEKTVEEDSPRKKDAIVRLLMEDLLKETNKIL